LFIVISLYEPGGYSFGDWTLRTPFRGHSSMAMAGIENMEVLDSYRRLSGRYQHACQVGKILSAGGMIGTALLFPITHADGLPFRALLVLALCFVSPSLTVHQDP
jgi:hypothetical protein